MDIKFVFCILRLNGVFVAAVVVLFVCIVPWQNMSVETIFKIH